MAKEDPNETSQTAVDSGVASEIVKLRAQDHESFGAIVMGMTAIPRSRHQTLADPQQIIFDPLRRDRAFIAYSKRDAAQGETETNGIVLSTSVAAEVDQKIREQIEACVCPIRLKPEEWSSGSVNWALDVIASRQKETTRVLSSFLCANEDLKFRLHPIVKQSLEWDFLEQLSSRNGENLQPCDVDLQ